MTDSQHPKYRTPLRIAGMAANVLLVVTVAVLAALDKVDGAAFIAVAAAASTAIAVLAGADRIIRPPPSSLLPVAAGSGAWAAAELVLHALSGG